MNRLYLCRYSPSQGIITSPSLLKSLFGLKSSISLRENYSRGFEEMQFIPCRINTSLQRDENTAQEPSLQTSCSVSSATWALCYLYWWSRSLCANHPGQKGVTQISSKGEERLSSALNGTQNKALASQLLFLRPLWKREGSGLPNKSAIVDMI